VLFSDTFNRTTFGTNDNGLGGTITAPWAVADAMGAAPSDMDASQLHLLGGASPDHNFVDPAITAAGGFVISFTVAPFWGCVPPHPPADGYWGGIGLGMSAADGNVWFYAAPDADFALLLRNNCNYEASSGSTQLVAFNQTPYTTNFTAIYAVRMEVRLAAFTNGTPFTVRAWVDGAELDVNGAATPGLAYSGTWSGGGKNYLTLGSAWGYSYFENFKLAALPAATVEISISDSQAVVNWTGANLQWSADLQSWEMLTNAPQPFIQAVTNAARFFRTVR
jgi:hypothetical protein